MPRKPHVPTDEGRRMVEALISRGMPRETIAQIMAITPKTLEKYYRSELSTGGDKATANVAGKLYAHCLSDKQDMPATVARLFWMKTHGWRESQVISHEGRDGEALGGTTNVVQLYLPDNGRDPQPALAPPMKTIEHIPAKATVAHLP
jgi:hypothetical protein